MKARNVILLAITAAVVVWAWQVSIKKAPTVDLTASKLYPSLIDEVNDVTTITIKSANDSTRLRKRGAQWVVENRDNFPARFEQVKQVMLKLAEARIIEQKTSVAEKYPVLGVNDPTEQDSTGTRVDFVDADGTALASLIIGNERDARAVGVPNYYVRRVEDAASYLVEGDLDIKARVDDWLDPEVVDIDTARIRRVTITPNGDDPIVIQKNARTDNFFELQDLPEGFKAKSRATVSSVGALLLGVRFEDVAAAEKVNNSAPRTSVEIQTFDGLIATIDQYDYQDSEYVKLSFAYDEDAVVVEEPVEGETDSDDASTEAGPSVAEEAAELNARTEGWIYVLPDYKMRMLNKRLGDLIEKIEEEETEAQAEAVDES